jgi:hypothetical protein
MFGGDLMVEQCSYTLLTMVGIGSVAQRGLGGRRMMMDARREVALAGTMVVSMAGLAR